VSSVLEIFASKQIFSVDILEIAKLSPHYDEVFLEGGLIEIDLDTGNE
jgi:hypothetical protein